MLDAKYKVWQSGPRASDSYQVVAGAWGRDAPVAALVYPSPGGAPKEPVRWRLSGNGNPLDLWALFLDLTDVGSRTNERALMDRLRNDLSALIG